MLLIHDKGMREKKETEEKVEEGRREREDGKVDKKMETKCYHFFFQLDISFSVSYLKSMCPLGFQFMRKSRRL